MRFLTPEQVADLLQVDSNTILLWLKQKKIPGVRIGNIWRIEEERLQTFLTQKLDKQTEKSSSYEEYEENFERAITRGRRGRKPTGKYDGLKNFLKSNKGIILHMSFAEVQDYVEDKLPQSAYRLRPWWANDYSHSQARAWLHAGWQTKSVDLKKHKVTFEKRK
ncbi:helix-turn-helix domain-containing protein [Pectinatus frisingensis]|uniref:helix-turn-helix domain-containing protein n=1 Tax=Pectinatus frisingensis TaxID=865 RepID=UPI0018C6535C|nr:helix-turn-helix domain-containing protein [Pectinatus frisingensis]